MSGLRSINSEFSDTHKFIFKVKESNPVHWDSDTLVSRKRRHIGQALLLPTHQVPKKGFH